MKRMILILVSSFLLIGAAEAQTTDPSVTPMCGLGQYWLVNDSVGSGVWIRREDSSTFDAYWSSPDDTHATMDISFDGAAVIADRQDTNTCHYNGELAADGVSVSGTVVCDDDKTAEGEQVWFATIVCGTPIIGWSENVVSQRAAKNAEFSFLCLPNSEGTVGTVWGTDIYTDDSSICTAAVHAGVISLAEGGLVSLEILAGKSSYKGTSRNDITTSSYGEWVGSYQFVETVTTAPPPITWDRTASFIRGATEQQFTFECLAGGSPAVVWGTDIYTDDSSICTAGVHAGVITDDGGLVTIEILPGEESYEGSTRNDVTSLEYGAWDASFRVVDPAAEDES
jgi:hypothetical protein